jgi:hypothetical protein
MYVKKYKQFYYYIMRERCKTHWELMSTHWKIVYDGKKINEKKIINRKNIGISMVVQCMGDQTD